MPKPDPTLNNYNWYASYNQIMGEGAILQALFPQEKSFTEEYFPSPGNMLPTFKAPIPTVTPLFGNERERNVPGLLSGKAEFPVGNKDYAERTYGPEIEAAHDASLRKRFRDYHAALSKRLPKLAEENPEGASILRLFLKWAEYPLRGYGTETWSDAVFSSVCSALATLHLPSVMVDPVESYKAYFSADPNARSPKLSDAELHAQNFIAVMDGLSDLPFLPVFENSARMIDLACDHANALRAGTLTAEQDRLSRRLLLAQYDQIAAGVLESIRTVDKQNNPEDFDRWARFMDDPTHVSTYARAPQRVPDNLEGRRIALRQGWPVEDTVLIGALFQMQAMALRPLPGQSQAPAKLGSDLNELIEAIGSTRITDAQRRKQMLDRIEGFLSNHAKDLSSHFGIQPDLAKAVMAARRAEKLLPCQFLSDEELDEAARAYERRRNGGDRAPAGYYEQVLAGTDVLSRLDSLYQTLAPTNKGRKDTPEYAFLRDGAAKLIGMISPFYGPDAPIGMERKRQLERIEAAHATLSDLAQTYLDASAGIQQEPAFKRAAAQALRDFCANVAVTAQATEKGMEAAEERRAGLDWRQKKDRDKNSYQKYLDEIWAAFLDARDAPEGDPYDYVAAAERGLKIEALNEKFDPLMKLLLQNGLSPEQVSALMAKAFPKEEADQLTTTITGEFLTMADKAMNNLAVNRKLPRSSVTLASGWTNLPEETKKEQIAETIRGMLDGKYYDRGVFTSYATPEQKAAIAQKLLSPDQLRSTYITVMDRTLAYRSKERDRLRVYRYLPEVLSSDELHTLVRELDEAPILHDRAEQTFLREKERSAIVQTRQHMETKLADNPSLLEEVKNALKDAETILRRGTEQAQRVAEANEKVCSHALNAYSRVAFEKEKAKAPGERAARCGPVVEFQGNDILPESTTEGARKILQMPKLPDKFRETLLKMLHKMDEMELLPKDMTAAAVEQGGKTYAYIQIGNAQQAYTDLILSADPDPEALIQARENYEKAYQNMKELLQLAEEGFGSEPTDVPDMFVTRQQYGFPWELVNTPHQGQVNTVFLMYQQMHQYNMTPEHFLDGLPRTLIQPWQEVLYKTRESLGLTGKDLAADLNVIMRPNAHESLDGWKTFPPDRFIEEFWKMLDDHDESFDRDGFVAWTSDATNLIRDISGRERARLELFSRSAFKPNFMELRNQSLQNLITVADEDRDYNQIIGFPSYNQDLEITPFSLDDYIRTHPIDPAAMERRLNIILDAAKKYPRAPSLEEVVTAGVAACTRVLTLRYADRDTEAYRALEQLTNRFVSRFPSVQDVTFVKKELEDAGMDSSDASDQMKRAGNLPKIRAQMEQYLQRYKEFQTKSQAIQPEEKPLERKAEEPKVEEPKIEEPKPVEPKVGVNQGGEPAPEENQVEDPKVEAPVPVDPVLLRREQIQNRMILADKDRELAAQSSFSLDEYIRTHEIYPFPLEQRLNAMISASEQSGDGPSREELLEAGLDACLRVLYRKQLERGSERYQGLEQLAKRLLARMPTAQGPGMERRDRMEQSLRRYERFLEAPSLAELTRELRNAHVPPRSSMGFEGLRASVQSLSELSVSLLRPGEDGRPQVLSAQSREDLKHAYQAVVNAAAAFRAFAEDDPNLAQAREQAEKISRLAARDMNVLTGARGADAATLAQVYERRSPTLDVTGLKAQPVGGGTGRRLALRIPVGNEKTLDGFFSPEQPLPTEEDELAALRQRIAKASPDAARAVRLMEEKSGSFRDLEDRQFADLRTWQKDQQMKTLDCREYDHRFDRCLREAGLSAAQIDRITNKAFSDAIDDYLMGRAQMKSRKLLTGEMNLKPGDPTALRSGAMSAVADALGIGSLLAASRPLSLTKNGKAVRGVFTERAVGSDVNHPRENDPILEMTEDTPLSPKALRQLASIHVLDFICGNVDRHCGSLLYQFRRDEHNALVLDGVQGIDSELSFMACPAEKGIRDTQVMAKELQTMPQSLAERVLLLDPAFLKSSLREFRLPEDQLDRAAERLRAVQDRIRSGLEYFKDKEPGATSDDHVHVLPDDDYGKLSKEAAKLIASKSSIHAIPGLAKRARLEQELLAPMAAFREDGRKLAGLFTQALISDEKVLYTSKEFAAMRDALNEVGKKHRALAKPNEEELRLKKTVHLPTDEELREIRTSYETLGQAARTYLAGKEQLRQRKGEASLNENTRVRMDLARRILDQFTPQLEHINQLPQHLAAAERLTQPEVRRREQQPGIDNPVRPQQAGNPESGQPQQGEPVPEKAGQPSEVPTAGERLSGLLRVLEEQRRKYAAALRDGTSGQKQDGLPDREALGNTLMEAFAVAELGTAAGPEVKADDRRVQLMRDLLKTDRRKQFGTYSSCLKALSENLPEAKLDLLHQAAFRDMRDAVSLCVSESEKLPERLEAISGILKDPEHFQKRVSDFVIAAKQERKPDAPQKKNKRGGGKLDL